MNMDLNLPLNAPQLCLNIYCKPVEDCLWILICIFIRLSYSLKVVFFSLLCYNTLNIRSFLVHSLCKSHSEQYGFHWCWVYNSVAVWPADLGEDSAWGKITLLENSSASTQMELYRVDVNKVAETEELGPCRSSRLLDIVPVSRSNLNMLMFLWAFSTPLRVCGVSTLHDYCERFASSPWTSDCGLDNASRRKSKAKSSRWTQVNWVTPYFGFHVQGNVKQRQQLYYITSNTSLPSECP